jgi:hypothetical protein
MITETPVMMPEKPRVAQIDALTNNRGIIFNNNPFISKKFI